MSELARLDTRVTILEQEMPEIRKLAADASTEVGDVHTRLRAHTKSLEALRETQLKQGRDIGDLRKTQLEQGRDIGDLREIQREMLGAQREMLDIQRGMLGAQQELHKTQQEQGREIHDLRKEMRTGFAAVDERFGSLEAEMREGFATMGVGMAQMTALIKIAIDKSGEP